MTKRKLTEHELEPFRIALQLEEEGKKFFTEAAEKTASKFARSTFEFLCSEEDRHIATIKEFYASLTSDDGDLLDVGESDADQKLASFNERLSKLTSDESPVQSDIDAYKFAIEFENGAEDFYAEKMAETDHPLIRKFYRWLIAEEKMHARLLKSCLRFVEDPAEWFKQHR